GYFLGYATLDLEEDDLDNGSGCTSPAPNQVLVAKGDEPNLASQVSGVTFGAETTEENWNTSSIDVTEPNVGILPKDGVGMKQPGEKRLVPGLEHKVFVDMPLKKLDPGMSEDKDVHVGSSETRLCPNSVDLNQFRGDVGKEEQSAEAFPASSWANILVGNQFGLLGSTLAARKDDCGTQVASPPLSMREGIDMRAGSGERRMRQEKSRGEAHPAAQQRGPSTNSVNQNAVQLGYSAPVLCLGIQAGYSVPPPSPAAFASLLSQACFSVYAAEVLVLFGTDCCCIWGLVVLLMLKWCSLVLPGC
ncbi:hypothetical protein U1Q18_014610, partial [Sarracenia purpurea var. burkii]